MKYNTFTVDTIYKLLSNLQTEKILNSLPLKIWLALKKHCWFKANHIKQHFCTVFKISSAHDPMHQHIYHHTFTFFGIFWFKIIGYMFTSYIILILTFWRKLLLLMLTLNGFISNSVFKGAFDSVISQISVNWISQIRVQHHIYYRFLLSNDSLKRN